MIGLIINPVAGLGGPAGLKGSDTEQVQRTARERGSVPRADARAVRALEVLASTHPGLTVITAGGSMGSDAVERAGLRPQVCYRPGPGPTSGDDTRRAAAAVADASADLVLFVGGDGTARDVVAGLPDSVAALGIPAGVKMYSACFAASPRAGGAIAQAWEAAAVSTGRSHTVAVQRCEVLDVSEDQVRHGRVDPTLYGLLPVPVVGGRTQARKAGTAASDRDAVGAAAAAVVAELEAGVTYLLGPGGTTAAVAGQLGITATPLGVDVIRDRRLITADADEAELRRTVHGGPTRAVITVIGGQGFLFGRGNQQFSPAVLRGLADPGLLVVATPNKLAGLAGRPLLVDTGDADLDATLSGYLQIITGCSERSIYPVVAPEAEPHHLEPARPRQ